ncbi:alpha-E domain-containing protein [Paraburkholderia sp. BR14263]|uniref:alpha-E domain-containing protein n=1 Tax=unclassified Paraburkholderia TaxID=2615204 RepID=UPI0034CE7270
MLSRTADHLFWMARYTERAENTARMLDVNYQTSLLPQSVAEAQQGWRAMLDICELTIAFGCKHASFAAGDVIDFMVCDLGNPSSILSAFSAARENARAVRGSLTTEVWETVNTTWLETQRLIASGMLRDEPSKFFEWVKFRSHLMRGVQLGTMLRDESFYFMRLGTFVERADNTARILDVKSRLVETDEGDFNRSHNDFYYWAAVLRSVSGFEVFRKIYRSMVSPQSVAELLILRPDMPRSLVASLSEVVSILGKVGNQHSEQTERLAGKLQADLKYARIDELFAVGLHVWLTTFLQSIGDLGNGISRDFLVPLLNAA